MRLRVSMLWGAILMSMAIGCSDDSEDGAVDSQVNSSQTSDASNATSDGAATAAEDASAPNAATDAGSSTVMDASAPNLGGDTGVAPDGASTADGGASADAASGEGGAGPMSGVSCLKGGDDFMSAGPYKFKSKTVTIGSKGMYTIVYPDPLEAACPHPFIAWGNGTTVTGGTAYRPFQEHAASYGIITVASHNSNVGDGTFHTAAIDYMLAENTKSGSEFFGKLSDRTGVSGHSQGGAGGDRGSLHKNVKANVNVQGSFGSPANSPAAFLCLTGTEDINPTGCPMAVKAAKVPAMCASYQGADHVSTTLGGGTGMPQYKRLYAAWFRCFLAEDAMGCALFKGGAECPVCKDKNWAEIFTVNY